MIHITAIFAVAFSASSDAGEGYTMVQAQQTTNWPHFQGLNEEPSIAGSFEFTEEQEGEGSVAASFERVPEQILIYDGTSSINDDPTFDLMQRLLVLEEENKQLQAQNERNQRQNGHLQAQLRRQRDAQALEASPEEEEEIYPWMFDPFAPEEHDFIAQEQEAQPLSASSEYRESAAGETEGDVDLVFPGWFDVFAPEEHDFAAQEQEAQPLSASSENRDSAASETEGDADLARAMQEEEDAEYASQLAQQNSPSSNSEDVPTSSPVEPKIAEEFKKCAEEVKKFAEDVDCFLTRKAAPEIEKLAKETIPREAKKFVHETIPEKVAPEVEKVFRKIFKF